ncbi:MAG: ACP S-malonyltransferase [Planctomycetota bacterium]
MSGHAFLFPGQGAQYVGMGRALVDSLPAARQLFDRAGEVLGWDLLDVCVNGPADRLDTTAVSQPALFVCSLAALEQLRSQSPDVVDSCSRTAGLSLGEYTALVFAGVLGFEDGLRVVQERGRAMQAAAEQRSSGMVSILGLERPALELLCDQQRQPGEVLQIANLLCPGNIVVSGDRAACARIAESAPGAGAMKAIPLAVAGAFHTSIMDPALEPLAKILAEVELRTPRIPVYSNVDAATHTDPEEIRRLLVQQVVSPVLWEMSLRAMIEAGTEAFYEIGPGRVLAGLLKRIDRKIKCENIAG